MLQHKKFSFIMIGLLIITVFSFFIFTNNDTPEENNPLQFNTSSMADESIVYLGGESAENEILLIFDYSCIWCSRWMDEVFPIVQKLVNDHDVKFRTQSMVFLNNASLELSKLDQNIKQHQPDEYYNVFTQIMADGLANDLEQLITGTYIEDILNDFQLDSEHFLAEPSPNVISLTEKYTEDWDIESVPTVIVNGVKIADPFDVKEIERLVK